MLQPVGKANLPGIIGNRAPWVRVALAYGGPALAIIGYAVGLHDAQSSSSWLVLPASWFLVAGGWTWWVWLMGDLFRREYGRAQIPQLSWLGAATGLAVAIVVGRDVLPNAIALGLLFGLGTWAWAERLVKRHLAELPPPPGAMPPADPESWAASSLRPPGR